MGANDFIDNKEKNELIFFDVDNNENENNELSIINNLEYKKLISKEKNDIIDREEEHNIIEQKLKRTKKKLNFF